MVLDPSFPEPEMPRTARALADGDLSRWMHWLLTAHVRRYQRYYHATRHIWQGRFKAFPIQDSDFPPYCARLGPGWAGQFLKLRRSDSS